MVQINWEQILSVRAASLSDQEIEDLFPVVIRCDVENVDDIHNLKALMKLSQEMLQHKDNQVESLLLECDELKQKILETTPASSARIKKPEGQLASDLVSGDGDSARTKHDSYSMSSNVLHNEDMLRDKNEKIATLISELEGLEEQNMTLKEKLKTVKEEMEDATEHMNAMTEDLDVLRNKNIMYKEQVVEREQENQALITQIESITAQQKERDKIIDEFSAAIDARVTEWKGILDEKDAEIIQLKESLSQSFVQSVTSSREHNKSQIIHLDQIIDQRDKTIEELQSKLSEAVVEMNESAGVIEKLKADALSIEKSSRRKDHRDLLRKFQEANEKVSNLRNLLKQTEDVAETKSKQLCEALARLEKFESGEYGLAEAVGEIKALKDQLCQKDKHIADIVNVINKMELLNSHQELKIAVLCEKLGMSTDEMVSVDGVIARHKQEKEEAEVLRKKNNCLREENLEMKSEIRTLKYKLKKLTEKVVAPSDTIDVGMEFIQPRKISEAEQDLVAEGERVAQSHMLEIDEIKENVRIVIEENEALRKGMHEILDSIHDQDGKSTVEIQSGTLERLLEALDVRHLAGWYHPAMRLQSRLNVIQGSNTELRAQLKQIRKELQKKDEILQQIVLNKNHKKPRTDSLSENEETSIYDSEMKQLLEMYQGEKEDWQKERNMLYEEKNELEDTITRLEVHLQEYEKNWQILESGEDEMKKAFAERSKQIADNSVQIIVLNRKCKLLEELLSKESTKVYHIQKEAISIENSERKMFADLEKRNKILENHIATLRSNLSNSVSVLDYNELKDKYNEMSIRYRMELEEKHLDIGNGELEVCRGELKLLQREKDEIVKHLEEQTRPENDKDLEKQLADSKSKELIERQRADHMTKLHEILQTQLVKCEAELKESLSIKSELNEQIIRLHKKLSKDTTSQDSTKPDENEVCELKEKIEAVEVEKEHFKRNAEIAQEEAQMYRSMNSLKTFELDSLRHQLLDLQSVSEDKETIARIGFELTNCRILEAEANKQKVLLEDEISRLRNGNEKLQQKCDNAYIFAQDCQKQCQSRCRNYLEMIDFLQQQYAGSTSLTALERFQAMLKKVMNDRIIVDDKLQDVSERYESVKLQQDILASRLQVVEQLKDILEQQIGSPNVQDILLKFSETSQHALSELRYKRQISNLENELQIVSNKVISHEATISAMESEMVAMQRIWGKSEVQEEEIKVPRSESRIVSVDMRSVSIQTQIENHSVATQSEYPCSCPREEVITAKEEQPQTTSYKHEPDINSIASLNGKLNEALFLASERSATLMKYELQLAEYQAKVTALSKLNDDKDMLLLQREKIIEQMKLEPTAVGVDGSDKIALKSTINSLQRIITQKEETIMRYQNLLKEDRDEHSKAAARLQEEIKGLQARITTMQEQMERRSNSSYHVPEPDNRLQNDRNKNIDLEEEAEKLSERVSTLEADLNIAKELGERWHRLAEERLKHMDHMRRRLEEQHKNELESYRIERDKWQSEADALRQQLSENRMQLAKGNISLAKELQERDNRIHELSMAYQHLQNELELAESVTLSQQMVARDSKMQEMATNLSRNQANQLQMQLDIARRQVQSLTEKEKSFKNQIMDLKQQLSRRYMAVKTQEQKASQRETQLERKVRFLEDELHKAKVQLDREHLAHEAKKLKTAEELALWDKQKRWQQAAEKFKEKLKEKTEEFKKLQSNYEKLRSVISCMEREKWYLKSKLRIENGNVIGSLSARPGNTLQSDIIEDLQQECHILRDRVKELTDRLDNEDNSQLILKVEKQGRHIAALEAVTQGNTYVVDQLERLEAAKDVLEKTNLRLESENLELRLENEKANSDTPRLREKVEHLEKYVELLKVEKSSDSTPRSSDKDSQDQGKKSVSELEKTIFILKRVVEKLQAENKRLKLNSKRNLHSSKGVRPSSSGSSVSLHDQYERAQQRVVALETDLQLAEQRIAMLENDHKQEENSGEIGVLRQQLEHKSELLDKVKQLLTRAAINEKALRQRVQQLEMKQTLSTIPECYVSQSAPEL